MAQFLSQEWLDLACEVSATLPEAAGPSLGLQLVVPGGPDGEIKVAATVTDGRLVRGTVGADAAADLTLTVKHADAVALLTAALDPNAAFMQGKIKVAGPTGPLLELLALAQTAPHVAARATVASRTET